MHVKIVYNDRNQPVEAIIPYATFKALESQIMEEDELVSSGPWPDPDLEEVRDALSKLKLKGVSAALQEEREDAR